MAQRFDIVIDSIVPSKLAKFWASALPGYAIRRYDEEEIARLAAKGLTPETDPAVAIDGDGPTFWFQKVDQPTQGRNRVHVDLCDADPATEVKRLQALGAKIRDEQDDHTVMLDPEGNQFCVGDW
ncbi:MAG: VOC family protein [Gammaproteobacteria bacterium]|jgi:hypothetical protein